MFGFDFPMFPSYVVSLMYMCVMYNTNIDSSSLFSSLSLVISPFFIKMEWRVPNRCLNDQSDICHSLFLSHLSVLDCCVYCVEVCVNPTVRWWKCTFPSLRWSPERPRRPIPPGLQLHLNIQEKHGVNTLISNRPKCPWVDSRCVSRVDSFTGQFLAHLLCVRDSLLLLHHVFLEKPTMGTWQTVQKVVNVTLSTRRRLTGGSMAASLWHGEQFAFRWKHKCWWCSFITTLAPGLAETNQDINWWRLSD